MKGVCIQLGNQSLFSLQRILPFPHCLLNLFSHLIVFVSRESAFFLFPPLVISCCLCNESQMEHWLLSTPSSKHSLTPSSSRSKTWWDFCSLLHWPLVGHQIHTAFCSLSLHLILPFIVSLSLPSFTLFCLVSPVNGLAVNSLHCLLWWFSYSDVQSLLLLSLSLSLFLLSPFCCSLDVIFASYITSRREWKEKVDETTSHKQRKEMRTKYTK